MKQVYCNPYSEILRLWQIRAQKSLCNRTLSVFLIFFLGITFVFPLNGQNRKLKLIVQTGHSGAVMAVAYSPDGSWIASGDSDGRVKLWETQIGRELRTMAGNLSRVASVAISPDGKIIAGGGSSSLKLWHAQTGNVIRTLIEQPRSWVLAEQASVDTVAFSPDGKLLASGGRDNRCSSGPIPLDADICRLRLWDVETGMQVKTILGHLAGVGSIAFSPDGKQIMSIGRDSPIQNKKTVKIWDVKTGKEFRNLNSNGYFGKELRTLLGHLADVDSIAFNRDRRQIGSATRIRLGVGNVKIWDVETGRELRAFSAISSVAFSPDGKVIAGGVGSKIKLFEAATGKEIKTFEGQTEFANAVAVSRDGRMIARALTDGTVRLWDLRRSEDIRTLNKDASEVQFSPNGKMLATASGRSGITLWDVESGTKLWSVKGHLDQTNSVAFSADGKSIVSGGGYAFVGNAKLWDVVSGKALRTMKDNSIAITDNCCSHAGVVMSVAFSPNGERIASSGFDNKIKVWDAKSGEKRITLPGALYFAVTFSPDSRMIAGASKKADDSVLRIWDITTGKVIREFVGHTKEILSIAYSPDGRVIASGSWDRTIRLWDVKTGEKLSVLPGHSAAPKSVVFSPDGKRLISSDSDGGVKFWDVATGKELVSFITFRDGTWVAVTSDGRFDTNKSLDGIDGLHWMTSAEPFAPKPLKIFMRQYYEPDLFRRVLKCNEMDTCDREFAPLPPISEANTLRTNVQINDITPNNDSSYTVDVTVEITDIRRDVVEHGNSQLISNVKFTLQPLLA